ncbi:Transcription initiation factor IIB, partial [Orchesella cincta]
VIDIGSEWRTFSNEATGADPCRVGSAENTLLNGSDLSTHTGEGIGTPGLMNLETQNTIHAGKKLRGRSTNSIAPACLCIASRQEGVPQTFKEVCAVFSNLQERNWSCVQARPSSTRYLRGGYYNGRFDVEASKFKRSQKKIGDVAGRRRNSSTSLETHSRNSVQHQYCSKCVIFVILTRCEANLEILYMVL